MDKEQHEMKKIACIVGPTASGKTALSIAVAERFGCEIIGCDSMQIYRYMNIGTAKPTEKEKRGVAHHLIDFLTPDKSFSAEAYRALAMEAISDITLRGAFPLVVGGTGLYLDTLLRKQSAEVPQSNPEYRNKILSGISSDADVEALWQRLHSIDPESAEIIHKNNIKRVIRAIEVYDATGKPKSYWDKLSKEENTEISALIIVLDFHNREILYERIDKRVDNMVKDGLVDEVKSLWDMGYLHGNDTASSAIGYKEITEYLRGECELDEAISKIKLASRRYAKRQLTWFRHEAGAKTVYADNTDGALRNIEELLCEITGVVSEFKE